MKRKPKRISGWNANAFLSSLRLDWALAEDKYEWCVSHEKDTANVVVTDIHELEEQIRFIEHFASSHSSTG